MLDRQGHRWALGRNVLGPFCELVGVETADHHLRLIVVLRQGTTRLGHDPVAALDDRLREGATLRRDLDGVEAVALEKGLLDALTLSRARLRENLMNSMNFLHF